MAEKRSETDQDGCGNIADAKYEANSSRQTPKRCLTTSPDSPPPNKSPRTDVQSPVTQTHDDDAGQERPEAGTQEMHVDNTAGSTGPSGSPPARRKSWRRATLTRRSLPALPNQYQLLCRSISTSLPEHERLEKLMEASMKLAIERTRYSLQALPNASMEAFQKQVEHIQKKWGCLAKSISSEPQSQIPASAVSDPAVQSAMEKIQEATKRLQAEGESWKALLNKHQSRAEELERKVEQGQKEGISLDSTSVAQSSQYEFIRSKPDYNSLLSRQQPMLHTMAMIMDTQCKMVRELLSVKEQAQLMVKETSGRLAAEAGFKTLSLDVINNRLAAPSSSVTT